jgi:quinol monooxygenase YgiN
LAVRLTLGVVGAFLYTNDQNAYMTPIRGNPGEIHELAPSRIRPDALEEVLAAINDFVAYVRGNESGALRYEVWHEADRPTRFVHIFVWRDEEANRLHGESAAVKKFAGILYPKCLAPVEFITYKQIDANASFRRV